MKARHPPNAYKHPPTRTPPAKPDTLTERAAYAAAPIAALTPIAHGRFSRTQPRLADQTDRLKSVITNRSPAEARGTRTLSSTPIGRLSRRAARKVVTPMAARSPG